MRWLIRRISRRRGKELTYEDQRFDGEVLTIGRATDQALNVTDIRAGLRHARIIPLSRSRFRIESELLSGVRVDGTLIQRQVVSLGAELLVGTTRIRLVKPPKGFEGAVEVEAVQAESIEERPRLPMRLVETKLRKRAPAWWLFGITLAIGLVLPVMGHLFGVAPMLRDAPLPDDGLWSTGELQAAHQFFGEDCSSCHQAAFRRVANEACLACHTATGDHADAAQFDLPALSDTRCAACHKDHNGPMGLVRHDQALCVTCHQSLSRQSQDVSELPDVADFGTAHPQFTVLLADWDESDRYRPRRVDLDAPQLSEESNLRFPHDVHLARDGISTPNGRVTMGCADCHQVEPGGGLMQPVDYETMCQDCHSLAFDPSAPNRQVPHARVAEVLYMLDEFYAKKALDGGYDDFTAPQIVRQRRRPGRRLTRTETREALAWARGKARRVGESLFEGQACGVCHFVERRPGASEVGWHVDPVRIAGNWYEAANFSHTSHATMECGSCHAAVESATSNDVLIPGIQNCRDCHAGESATGKVASTCITCHDYHTPAGSVLADRLPWSPTVDASTVGSRTSID